MAMSVTTNCPFQTENSYREHNVKLNNEVKLNGNLVSLSGYIKYTHTHSVPHDGRLVLLGV